MIGKKHLLIFVVFGIIGLLCSMICGMVVVCGDIIAISFGESFEAIVSCVWIFGSAVSMVCGFMIKKKFPKFGCVLIVMGMVVFVWGLYTPGLKNCR